MKNKENFNFDEVLVNLDKVKEIKASKEKKSNKSIKPLNFEPLPGDSPLKAEIIRRINEKNLTYGDLYEYCTKIKGGNVDEGQNFGYNIISGLRKRHTMIDTTFAMLCDFLEIDIKLVSREDKKEKEDTE